jgi:hypothetical protein
MLIRKVLKIKYRPKWTKEKYRVQKLLNLQFVSMKIAQIQAKCAVLAELERIC